MREGSEQIFDFTKRSDMELNDLEGRYLDVYLMMNDGTEVCFESTLTYIDYDDSACFFKFENGTCITVPKENVHSDGDLLYFREVQHDLS